MKRNIECLSFFNIIKFQNSVGEEQTKKETKKLFYFFKKDNVNLWKYVKKCVMNGYVCVEDSFDSMVINRFVAFCFVCLFVFILPLDGDSGKKYKGCDNNNNNNNI